MSWFATSRGAAAQHCPGPLSRRSFLGWGALGLSDFSLGDYLKADETARQSGRALPDTSVIFIWLPGGPPHTEMYDLKPKAPLEYRGEFLPISTKVPGLDICEHLPLHAKFADKYNIIRSMAHEFAGHDGGHKRFLTGRIPLSPVGFVNDAPAVGSIVAKSFESRRTGLPNYVCGCDSGRVAIDTYSFGSAYLGSSYTPFMAHGDPSDPKFQVQNLELVAVTENRLEDRAHLLTGFDNLRRDIDRSGKMSAMDKFHQQALTMLTSTKARDAFDLSQEAPALRDRYGRHAWGQRALMARRLIEAGCTFVTMVMENPYVSGVARADDGTYNWDSHGVNCHMYNDLRNRLPIYDQAVTALVEDIYARGLDRQTLVIVTGEFGRTPRIMPAVGSKTRHMQPGRDHWPKAMSLLVFGGGMRTGQVIGSTNAKAEMPLERPLTPNDLWATVYRHLGIDPEQTFPDFSGRPMPILPFGQPIAELLPA